MIYTNAIILMMTVVGFFIAMTAVYFSTLVEFLSKLKKEDGEYWKNIGKPNNFDAKGQAVILGLIFLPRRFPSEKFNKYKKLIYRARISTFLGLVSFAALILMLKLGFFVSLN